MKPTTISTSIGASGFSAALIIVIIWALKSRGIEMPADVAAAVGTIFTGLTHYAVAFERKAQPPTEPPEQSPAEVV